MIGVLIRDLLCVCFCLDLCMSPPAGSLKAFDTPCAILLPSAILQPYAILRTLRGTSICPMHTFWAPPATPMVRHHLRSHPILVTLRFCAGCGETNQDLSFCDFLTPC